MPCRTRRFLAAAACLLALTACEGAKRELGLVRRAPDEFAVVKRAPLAMPPDYSLRPPRPGAPRPQEMTEGGQGRAAVFGAAGGEEAYQPSGEAGSGESALLQAAGAAGARPQIRDVVDREAAEAPARDKPVAEKLLGIRLGRKDEPAASVVNAPEEAERLKKNVEEGKSVTEGTTPAIEQ